MKKTILTGILILVPYLAICQSLQFSLLNTHFVLIPGGGFETKAWIYVPPGDTVHMQAESGTGMHALFQPATLSASQFVYLVVISTDTNLAPQQTMRLVARTPSDSIVHWITVDNHYNGHGFYLIDSAKYYQAAAFTYLLQALPSQSGLLDSLRQIDWIPCFPYPPLLVVTHHLFVSGDWRMTVLWHNMIPPHNWVKMFLYNELQGISFGVNIDTWGAYSLIPCEIMHYNQQDTITARQGDPSLYGILAYPNPTDGVLRLQLDNPPPHPMGISLYAANGNQVLSGIWDSGVQEMTLDLHSLPAGVYFLAAPIEAGNRKMKIIKY